MLSVAGRPVRSVRCWDPRESLGGARQAHAQCVTLHHPGPGVKGSAVLGWLGSFCRTSLSEPLGWSLGRPVMGAGTSGEGEGGRELPVLGWEGPWGARQAPWPCGKGGQEGRAGRRSQVSGLGFVGVRLLVAHPRGGSQWRLGIRLGNSGDF